MAEQDLGKIGLTPRGVWSVTETTYERLDLVSYIDGCSYVVVNPSVGYLAVGILPTNTLYYQLNAKKGDVGSSSGIAYPTVAPTAPYAGQVYMVDTASYGATFTQWGTIANATSNVVPLKVGELYVSNARLVRNVGNTAWVLGYESLANGAPDLSSLATKAQFDSITTFKNLFNLNDITTGYYLNLTTAEPVADSKSAHSNYIPVSEKLNYVFSGLVSGSSGNVVAFYDASKVLISFIKGQVPLMFETPALTTYLRSNIRVINSSVPNYALIQLEKGTIATAVESQSVKKIAVSQFDKLVPISGIDIRTVTSKNLFNFNDLIYGSYLNVDGSKTSNNTSAHSNYIAVSESVSYLVSGLAATAGHVVAFYDSNRALISGLGGAANLGFTTPALTAYIKFNVRPTLPTVPDYTIIQLEQGQYRTILQSFGALLKVQGIFFDGGNKINGISGKRIGFIGDSISDKDAGSTLPTAENLYCGVLASKYNIIPFVNGIAGSKIVGGMATPARWQSFAANELDALIVFGGTNDWSTIVMGTKSDLESAATFYGTLKYFMHSLLDYYKTTKIFFMTPLHRTLGQGGNILAFPQVGSNGVLFSDVVDAIKYVAGIYGVTIIDTYQSSGLNYWNMMAGGPYTVDGLHPNNAGHARIADYVAGILNQHLN